MTMSTFLGFRDFIELYTIPSTPESERMLNEPPPDIQQRKINKKLIKYTPGGKVKDGVFRPNQTLGIDRINMPQFKDKKDFLRWMMGLGVKVERVSVSPISLLKDNDNPHVAFAQNSIYVKKALKKIKNNETLSSLIILSQENIIVDGNHHWFALIQVAPYTPVPMFRINLPFDTIIHYASKYPKVSYEA